MELKQEILKMFNDVETNKKKLKALKITAIDYGRLELAAGLRDIEKKNFPETEDEKQAKKDAYKLSSLFRMVDLNISNDVAWLINKTLSRYKKRRGNFDLKDASEIIHLQSKYFSK